MKLPELRDCWPSWRDEDWFDGSHKAVPDLIHRDFVRCTDIIQRELHVVATGRGDSVTIN
jgi:hypothetical protein